MASEIASVMWLSHLCHLLSQRVNLEINFVSALNGSPSPRSHDIMTWEILFEDIKLLPLQLKLTFPLKTSIDRKGDPEGGSAMLIRIPLSSDDLNSISISKNFPTTNSFSKRHQKVTNNLFKLGLGVHSLYSAYASPEKYEPFSTRGKHCPKLLCCLVKSWTMPFTLKRRMQPLKSSFRTMTSLWNFGGFWGKPPINSMFATKNFFGSLILALLTGVPGFFPFRERLNATMRFRLSIVTWCHWPSLVFSGNEISSRFLLLTTSTMLPLRRNK